MSQILRISLGLNLVTGNQTVEQFSASLAATVGNVVEKHQFRLAPTESKSFSVVEGQTFIAIPIGPAVNVRVRDDSDPLPVVCGTMMTGLPFIVSGIADLENLSLVALDSEGDGGEFVVYIISPEA